MLTLLLNRVAIIISHLNSLVPEKPSHLSSFDLMDSPHNQLKAKVMFSYTASQDDEITIKEGDIVDVITMETGQDGWWMVRYDIQEGLAPSSYLSPIQSVQSSFDSIIRGIIKIFLHNYISRLY